MVNDTKNSLTDFDMCLALAQKSINSQMKAAWNIWLNSKRVDQRVKNMVSIFPLTSKGKPSKYGLEANFEPLSINLYVPSSKLGQVQVTLHLKSGKVTYFDEEEEEKTSSCEIKDWSVSFLTDLAKKPCDLETLEQINPEVRGSVEKVISESGLPEATFSIEYLFMKFTQVNLQLSDNKNINIPNDVPRAAKNQALNCLNDLLQGESGDFMMGTVVRRSKTTSKGSLPTFALTDFIFNVKADEVPEASTLSYLGMFSRRPLPSDIDTARIALQDNWVRPEMLDGTEGTIAGTMAISKSIFFDKYLLPKFTHEFKVQPQPEGLGWKYELPSIERSASETDVVERCYSTKVDAWLKITIEPGTNKLQISGRIDAYANYDSYLPSILKSLGREAWIHLAGHQDINATVLLTASGGTQDFKVNTEIPEQNYFSEVYIDKNETKGTAILTKDNRNIFSRVFEGIFGKTVNETIASLQKKQQTLIREVIDENLGRINMSLKNQSFIPPGGGVFTFQSLRFSDAGDLLFDVIYKAP